MHSRKAIPTTDMTMGLKIAVAVQKRNFPGEFTSKVFSVLSSCQKHHSGFGNNQGKCKEWKAKYYFAICTVRRREGNCKDGPRCGMWLRKKGWWRDRRVLDGFNEDVCEKMKWEWGSNSLKTRRQTLGLLASQIKPFQRSSSYWTQKTKPCCRMLWLRGIQQLGKWEMSNKPWPVGSWELCGQI